MKARTASVVVLAGLMVAPACQGDRRRPDAVLPPGPQVVEVTMTDYAFDYDPAITAGRVLFRVVNRGRLPHDLSLVPLSEDIPPIGEQLRSSERRGVAPFAGISIRPPGGRTSFAVDLAPGVRYAFICFVDDPDGVSHSVKGMSSEFRSLSPDGKPASPANSAPAAPAAAAAAEYRRS